MTRNFEDGKKNFIVQYKVKFGMLSILLHNDTGHYKNLFGIHLQGAVTVLLVLDESLPFLYL